MKIIKKKMIKKKAQLQMSESIFVVFIILIIIVLGFVIYTRIQEGTIKEHQRIKRNTQIIEMAHRLTSWPELECSDAGVTEFVCLDAIKLKLLGDFINKSRHNKTYTFNYYYDLLKDSKITVTEVYPSHTQTLGVDSWVLYENPGTTRTIDTVFVPVSLYDPLTKTSAFGIMELEIYE